MNFLSGKRDCMEYVTSSKVMDIAYLLLVTLGLSTVILALLCESHVNFVDRHVDENNGHQSVCHSIALLTNRWLNALFRHSVEDRETKGLFVWGVTFPFMVTACSLYIMDVWMKEKENRSRRTYAAVCLSDSNDLSQISPTSSFSVIDPSTKWAHLWSCFVLLVPTGFIVIDVLMNIPDSPKFQGLPWITKATWSLANPFGVLACISLTFFLVPVARGSTSSKASMSSPLRFSPIHTLIFHRWAGWFCAFFTCYHAIFFIMFEIVRRPQSMGVTELLLTTFIPPAECWMPSRARDVTSDHHRRLYDISSSEWANSNDTFARGLDHQQNQTSNTSNLTFFGNHSHHGHHGMKNSSRECDRPWLFLTGFISAFALLLLCVTSFQMVRRKIYSFFYKVHVVTGPIMMLFAIFHWPTVIMYLFPSLCYYIAMTIPILFHQFRSWQANGVTLSHAYVIPDSAGCIEMVFDLDPDSDGKLLQCSTPSFARLCVPSISGIWHPFSVMITSCDKVIVHEAWDDEPENHSKHLGGYQARILFRTNGHFTQKLATLIQNLLNVNSNGVRHSMQSSVAPPTILLDGLYPGSFDAETIYTKHKGILMVAGGVGVVPFVSLLQAFAHWRLGKSKCPDNQRVLTLVWACREPGLLNHVLSHYLSFLWSNHVADPDALSRYAQNEGQPDRIKIICHLTCHTDSDEGTPRTLADTNMPLTTPATWKDKGNPFTPNHLDWSTLFGFVTVIATSSLVQAWQYVYSTDIQQRILNANSVWISIAVSLFVAIVFQNLYECLLKRPRVTQFRDRGDGEDVVPANTTGLELSPSRTEKDCDVATLDESMFSVDHFCPNPPRTPVLWSGRIGEEPFEMTGLGDASVSIEVLPGRPILSHHFDELETVVPSTTASMALLVCGPKKIRDSAREVANSFIASRGRHEFFFRKTCIIYEEVSEM